MRCFKPPVIKINENLIINTNTNIITCPSGLFEFHNCIINCIYVLFDLWRDIIVLRE